MYETKQGMSGIGYPNFLKNNVFILINFGFSANCFVLRLESPLFKIYTKVCHWLLFLKLLHYNFYIIKYNSNDYVLFYTRKR